MGASTILLADDDETLCRVLRRVLTQQGHRVMEAHTVAQALEAARGQKPDLGLLDLRLPDGDGVELARRLADEGGRFPLVLMTAYPLRLRDHPEMAADFARVLTKPLNLQELRQAVDAALTAAPPAPHDGPAAAAAPPAPSPEQDMAEPAETPRPTAEPPSPRRPRWLLPVGITTAVALLAALWFVGLPYVLKRVQAKRDELAARGQEPDDSGAQLVPGDPNAIRLPPEVVRQLGVQVTAVQPPTEPRPLRLSGALNYDADHLASVRSRFAGEVVEIAKTNQPNPAAESPSRDGSLGERLKDKPAPRPLSFGDRVEKGQLLAVVWSSDQGTKKSALVDAYVKLWLDEETLKRYEDLYKNGNLPEASLRAQRNQVSSDRNAVRTATRLLVVSRVPQEEIDEVVEEAHHIFDLHDDSPKKQRGELSAKEKEWARVEVRAPIAGTLVERNTNIGAIVDTGTDLFKVADLGTLAAWVYAYEEDLYTLQDLPRPIPWSLRLPAEHGAGTLTSPGLQKIAPALDPTQHTATLIGPVENPAHQLKVGSFVTATVELPPPRDVVAVPASGVPEDDGSFVFVQPDPRMPVYTLRRVDVVLRLEHVVYVRSVLPEDKKRRGLRELHPGERVVTQGAMEMRGELRVASARALAKEKNGD
jgi:cobalt-zinc-cadmium efflux system membrane fusion protein